MKRSIIARSMGMAAAIGLILALRYVTGRDSVIVSAVVAFVVVRYAMRKDLGA